MKMPSPCPKMLRRVARPAAAALLAIIPAAAFLTAAPVSAQFTVFDPTNYAQNLLSATRALTQINNQIQSLQNQAAMLTNMSRNLSRIDFPQLQQLNQSLQQIDRLMSQAQGINFRVDLVDGQFQRLFPQDSKSTQTTSATVADAKARLDAAMTAYRQTIAVQAQVVGNIQSDSTALSAIVAKSQSAEGALQASQATNQLLALAAKQQFQIQTLLAAQYRADAMEQARRLQAQSDARAATAKFLGSGAAYTPR